MFNFLSNITFFNTTSLIALFVLLIPIIIHLINPNKATVIWVASIRLIKASDLKRVFQIKWLEKLLLLVRLILFTLITLIIAKPIFFVATELIEEEHHYYSVDWLENISNLEVEKIIKHAKNDRKTIETKNKYFILEEFNSGGYSDFKELHESYKVRTDKISINFIDQSGYIAELEQRTVIPRLTHLYLTNRSSNYSEAFSIYNSSYPVAIHVKSINTTKMNKILSIEIVYDINLVNEKDMLLLALKALKSNSQLSISVNERVIDSKKEDSSADLMFQVGGPESNKNKRSKVLVKTIKQGLRFTQLNGYEKVWNQSSPIDLITIISQIINELDEISETEILDKKTIQQFFNKNNLSDEENKSSKLNFKFLQPYLIFLFCLFLLLERWMVLRGVKPHD